MLRHTLGMFRSSTARGLAFSHRKAFSSANGAVQSSSSSKKLIMGGLVGAAGAAQVLLCPQDDWYHYTFKTCKDPDCLADFYGGEEFMQIFCVFPFVESFMMRCASFDAEGNVHTYGLGMPGSKNMEIHMDFEDQMVDTDGDGEPDTTAWFNKREDFKDSIGGGKLYLWHMINNFGFQRLSDGTCEVYHNGEHFHGPFFMRIIFQLHAMYVIRATEKVISQFSSFGTISLLSTDNCHACLFRAKVINSKGFGADDDEEWEKTEEMRHNVPKAVAEEFIVSLEDDFRCMIETLNDKAKPTEHLQETLAQLQKLKGDDAPGVTTVTTSHPKEQGKRLHTTKKLKVEIDDPEAKATVSAALKHLALEGVVAKSTIQLVEAQNDLHPS